MSDLYIGVCAIVCLSIAAFIIASRFARRAPDGVSSLLAIVTVLCTLAYLNFVWYNARIAEWLPYSNLIVLGNWFPILGGILAGIAWQQTPGSLFRRSLGVAGLIIGAHAVLIYPLIGKAPVCQNNWNSSGYCIQTTDYTCSPACAVTLLKIHNIETTEQEMAHLCLTRRGTSWMGLYHGLKRKTIGTNLDVEVVDGDAEQLCLNFTDPVILTVGIDHDQQTHPSYLTERGWIPGVNHSVILLRVLDSTVEVFDPTPGIGREFWTKHELELLYQGNGLRIVQRHDKLIAQTSHRLLSAK